METEKRPKTHKFVNFHVYWTVWAAITQKMVEMVEVIVTGKS